MSQRQELYGAIQALLSQAYEITDPETGETFADAFHQLPPRSMHEYYQIITRPVSYAKIRSALKGKKYREAQQFVNDLAQIGWNARFFNDESSVYNHWGVLLDNYVKQVVIPKMNEKYSVKYPKLPPLPGTLDQAEEQINSQPLDVSVDLGEEMDVDMPVEDNSSDMAAVAAATAAAAAATAAASSVMPNVSPGFGGSGSGLGGGSNTAAGSVEPDSDLPAYHPSSYVSKVQDQSRANVYLPPPQQKVINNKQTLEQWVKRGRPPVVDKPHEQRIKSIMRGLKKIKVGNKTIVSFWDKLPNAQDHPDYLRIVKEPLSMLDIKGLIKQRYYTSVDQYIADVFKLINNNRMYYTTNEFMKSKLDILETNISKLYQLEMVKPDSDYISNTQTGRTPLPYVVHNGRTYKVGNWVLVKNPNDSNVPIVGQIFRLWQEGSQAKMNVCWYYKPEWTVHRYDRLFLDNEVVKTGQYRDHLLDDLLGPCYVAYFTRWLKGDPGVIYEGPLFVCEFRYNEREMTFAKIRTWKACLPDEVRHIEDPVKPLSSPRVLRKYPSPIKHMLPPNATSHSPIPNPVISNLNAPPLIGGVYVKRDNDEEDPHYFDATLLATQFKTYIPPTTNIRLPSSVIVDQPIQLQQQMDSNVPQATPLPDQLSQQQINSLKAQMAANTASQFQKGLNLPKHNMSFIKHTPSVFNKTSIQWSPYSSSTPSSTFVLINDSENNIGHWVKRGYTQLDHVNNDRVKKAINQQQDIVSKSKVWTSKKNINGDGPLLWFKAAPLKITSRIVMDLGSGISKKRGGPLEAKGGFKCVKVGHSAKYLEWKRKQLGLQTDAEVSVSEEKDPIEPLEAGNDEAPIDNAPLLEVS